MYKQHILIIVGLLLVSSSFGQIDDVLFQHLDTEDGLSQSTVNCLIQDKYGFIWFGTNDGLNKYDGNSFNIYINVSGDSTSISYNDIKSLYVDDKGALWVGTYGNGLNKYNYNNDTFTRYVADPKKSNTIANNRVYGLINDENDRLWIATNEGISVLDETSQTFKNYYSSDSVGFTNDNIREIYKTSDGTIWIGNYFELAKYSPETDSFISYYMPEELKDSSSIDPNIFVITEKNKDELWIGCYGSGLLSFNKKNEKFTLHKDPNLQTGLRVFAITTTKNNEVWMATRNKGLVVYSPEFDVFRSFMHDPNFPTSISDNDMRCLGQDESGVMWVGGQGGVNKYDPARKKFTHYTYQPNNSNSISDKNIWALKELKNGKLLIGTNLGLDIMDPSTGTVKRFGSDADNMNGMENKNVNSVFDDIDGNIWVGTREAGLHKLDTATGVFRRIVGENLPSNMVLSIYQDKNKRIWLGTDGGLALFNPEDESYFFYRNDKNDPHSIGYDNVRRIIEDKDGVLWIGTYGGGLNKFDVQKGTFKRYIHNENDSTSISNNNVRCFYIDSNENFWIGTSKGLNLYHPENETFTSILDTDGLPNNVIYGVLGDQNGDMWVSTNNGLCRFNYERSEFKTFTQKDGTQDNEFNGGAYCKGKNGTLYFGGINGINIFNPDSINTRSYVPNVVVTDFQLFNISVKIGERKDGRTILKRNIQDTEYIELTYSDRVFSFEFTALDFASPASNKYAYILENFEKQWNYTSSERRFATYTNLNAGTYTFKVKGTNSDGIWNKIPTEITIKILPPFWETWWFRVLLIVAIIGTTYYVVRKQINAVKQRNEELERLVQERTVEIEEQAQDLTVANEQLQTKQEEIQEQSEELRVQASVLQDMNSQLQHEREQTTSSIQYAKTIQQALLPLPQIIEGLVESFILYRPKDIVSGDFYWFSEIESNGIKQLMIIVADCTGHGVPGAFMSMIGNSQLNKIVRENKIHNPSDVLDELNNGIRNVLKQERSQNNDGMDVVICLIEYPKDRSTEHRRVLFAGAKRPLIYFSHKTKQIEYMRGSRKAIGGNKKLLSTGVFETNELILLKGDVLYLTSDGFVDQNAPNRSKYGSKRLFRKLESIAGLPMWEQKAVLENALDEFMEREQQRDDIVFVGLKL